MSDHSVPEPRLSMAETERLIEAELEDEDGEPWRLWQSLLDEHGVGGVYVGAHIHARMMAHLEARAVRIAADLATIRRDGDHD